MADLSRERPAIHVCQVAAAPADLDRWVEIGAEEEGIPTRSVTLAQTDVVAAAYAAAQSSRIDVGVGVGVDRVVLHESHMPPHQPVLTFDLGADPRRVCRRIGSNAARLVARLPLRLEDEPDEQPVSEVFRHRIGKEKIPTGKATLSALGTTDDDSARRIAEIVAAIVKKRGM